MKTPTDNLRPRLHITDPTSAKSLGNRTCSRFDNYFLIKRPQQESNLRAPKGADICSKSKAFRRKHVLNPKGRQNLDRRSEVDSQPEGKVTLIAIRCNTTMRCGHSFPAHEYLPRFS